MKQHKAVLNAKHDAARAEFHVEEARLAMEARMVDLQVAEKEQMPQELSLRANKALEEAQREYQKRAMFRDALLQNHYKLKDEKIQAATERDLQRFGVLGRFPSNSNLSGKELPKMQDPWLDSDYQKWFRWTLPFNKCRVAKFYKKHYWGRVLFEPSSVQCMVTGNWSNRSGDIVASRILPKTTPKSVLKSLGLKRKDINDPRNMLLMSRNIKRYFDTSRLTFIMCENEYKNVEDAGLCFQLKVWDQHIRGKRLYPGSTMTIGDFEGKPFRFFSDDRLPFVRALSYHAQRTYERALKRLDIYADTEPRPLEFGCPLRDCETISYDEDEYDAQSETSSLASDDTATEDLTGHEI